MREWVGTVTDVLEKQRVEEEGDTAVSAAARLGERELLVWLAERAMPLKEG